MSLKPNNLLPLDIKTPLLGYRKVLWIFLAVRTTDHNPPRWPSENATNNRLNALVLYVFCKYICKLLKTLRAALHWIGCARI
jgi:hypothetical protein